MATYNNSDRTPPSTVEIDRTQLYTTAPGTSTERSSLIWQMYNTNTGVGGWNPRITVWTRVPGDTEKLPIQAPLNAASTYALLSKLDEAIMAEPGFRATMTCEGNKYDPTTKEKLQGIHVLSKVHVGKDKEGCVWISVVSADESRPKIQFKFNLGNYHHFEHKDGTPYTEAELSVVAAKGVVQVLRDTLAKYIPLITDEQRKARADAREQRTGGNGGGYKSQQPSKSKVDFEDITF